MADILGMVVSGLTALLLSGAVLTGLGKYVLLPWLRDHLVKPMEETRHNVTANSHASKTPTLPDRIDDVSQQVDVLARMFTGHMGWSEKEVQELWQAIAANTEAIRKMQR